MLYLTVPKGEKWLESEQRFIETDKDYDLVLEHSLVSISKWEEEFKKPFMSSDAKTEKETLFYIKCMTINEPIPDIVYRVIPDDMIEQINEYIAESRTATEIKETKQEGQSGGLLKGGKPITNEYMYSLMVSYNIPIEAEKWHFSRLMTLIKLLHKQQADSDPSRKKKRMSPGEIMARNNQINAMRRKRLKTRG